MKIIIALCALVAVTCAEVASSNKYELHHTEHEKSVAAARQLAQERLAKIDADRGYNSYGSQYGNAYGASGSEKYVQGCSSCIGGSENLVSYNSRQSSSSQRSSTSAGHGLSSSDYTGVGIVGRVDDTDDDVQNIVSPNYAGSSGGLSRYYSSAQNAHEADDMQQRVVPKDLSHVSSSAYRVSGSENDENELQRNVGSGYNSNALRSYAQQRHGEAEDDEDVQRSVSSGYSGGSQRAYSQGSESARTVSQVVPTYNSGSSLHRTAASQSESELNESRRPIYSGQTVRISARPGTHNVIAVPVRVIQTTGVQSTDDQGHVQSRTSEYSAGSDSSSSRVQHPTSTTYRVVYNPSRNYVTSDKIATGSESEGTRTINAIPTADKLTNYNSYNQQAGSQSRFRAEDEGDSQVRVIPGRVSYPSNPSNGGTSRVASSGAAGSNYYQQRVAVAPVSTVESSSTSARTAEEREERRYNPSVPTYITSGRVATANQDESRVQGGTVAGTYVIPARSQNRYYANQQAGTGAQSQYQNGATFSPYVPSRSFTGASSADRLSTRFGTGDSGVQTGELQTFMSESERLARLQQQQIAGSSSGGSLSTYDANRRTVQNAANLDSAAATFVRTSNLASRTSDYDTASVDAGAARVGAGSGAGGYHNVRSWNKQSKWSSGSEYGNDGKPKTYSTLSTGEGEKFNVNGAETSYKAATTTLENDGKSSTYSIRTP